MRGIRFGIIIGGTPDPTDNLSWTRAGLGQLQSLADDSAGGHHCPIVAAFTDTIPAGNRSRNEHLDATSGRTAGSMSPAR